MRSKVVILRGKIHPFKPLFAHFRENLNPIVTNIRTFWGDIRSSLRGYISKRVSAEVLALPTFYTGSHSVRFVNSYRKPT